MRRGGREAHLSVFGADLCFRRQTVGVPADLSGTAKGSVEALLDAADCGQLTFRLLGLLQHGEGLV